MATNDPKPLTGCPDKTLELDRMKIWTFCFSLDKTRILCSNKPIVPPPAATSSSISGMIPWDVVWVAGSSRMLSFSSISQGPRVFCLLPNEEESSTPLCTCSSSKKKATSVRDLLVYCPFTSVSMDLSNWNNSLLLKTNSVSLSEENLMNLLYPNRISWCPRAVCRDARMHFHFQKVSLFQNMPWLLCSFRFSLCGIPSCCLLLRSFADAFIFKA